MDFVTHTLVGAGAARLACPQKEWLPQLTLSAVLGSLLIDADPWLYLIDPAYYGKYHRVASHCLMGLVVMSLVCAGLAWSMSSVKPWRRFGWFVSDNLQRQEEPPSRAPFRLLLFVAACAVVLHFLGDIITGFGNMLPFWPFSNMDYSMHAVSSFDVAIFSTTLLWHVLLRTLKLSRRREAILSAGYFVLVVVYILFRWKFGPTTVW
ncbi:metal-dependent hydrolase [bacterium]|nr:metal-dependent hydrolase [bacterium]